MSNYKGIKGFQVQTRTEDPSEGIAGDFYYNSTTGQFKTISAGVGTWSSGANTPGFKSLFATAGTRDTTYLFAGGDEPGINDSTILYNGTSWSEQAELNLDRSGASGFGTSTAAVCTGGYRGEPPSPGYQADTEEWDGSSWTEVTDSPQIATNSGAAGSQTAGLQFGGGDNPGLTANTKTYDGTNWTEVNNLNTAKRRAMGYCIGTQTASLMIAGESATATLAEVESWDGTSWTEITDVNTARYLSAGSGSQTSSVIAGGRQGSNRYTNTELWDGTSWTETNDLATSRSYNVGSGSGDGSSANNSQQMYAAGVTGPSSTGNTTATEEWNIPDFEIKSVTTS